MSEYRGYTIHRSGSGGNYWSNAFGSSMPSASLKTMKRWIDQAIASREIKDKEMAEPSVGPIKPTNVVIRGDGPGRYLWHCMVCRGKNPSKDAVFKGGFKSKEEAGRNWYESHYRQEHVRTRPGSRAFGSWMFT